MRIHIAAKLRRAANIHGRLGRQRAFGIHVAVDKNPTRVSGNVGISVKVARDINRTSGQIPSTHCQVNNSVPDRLRNIVTIRTSKLKVERTINRAGNINQVCRAKLHIRRQRHVVSSRVTQDYRAAVRSDISPELSRPASL